MERGDLCVYCLDADCPSTINVCPARATAGRVFVNGAELRGDPERPGVYVGPPGLMSIEGSRFGAGRGPWSGLDLRPIASFAACGFCLGDGGYGVACHGCGRIGGWVRS